jgi:hypothetical protein
MRLIIARNTPVFLVPTAPAGLCPGNHPKSRCGNQCKENIPSRVFSDGGGMRAGYIPIPKNDGEPIPVPRRKPLPAVDFVRIT